MSPDHAPTSLLPGLLAALVADAPDAPDVHDALRRLVASAQDGLGAAAVAVLAAEDDRLVLVAATSHRAGELEMLQAQQGSGPCVEAIASGADVRCTDPDELVSRWGEVGEAIADAGFEAVVSLPVRWRGRTLAGLNLFYAERARADRHPDLQRAFAVAVTVAAAVPRSHEDVLEQLGVALRDRDLVALAKGVVAELDRVPMDAAYDVVRDAADRLSTTVTEVARLVVERRTSPASWTPDTGGR